MIMSFTNQPQTTSFQTELDTEEQMLIASCVSKIKKHLDRNLELAQSPSQVSRLLTAKWYINQNY
ncbi:MAG: hypothetical protein RLP11_03685 [Marinoscillum sp.]|uniref:hypothetical protein n=2 Tax=Marinoscillum sp. TaxID=2024838 RepID=UPI0032F1F6F4